MLHMKLKTREQKSLPFDSKGLLFLDWWSYKILKKKT